MPLQIFTHLRIKILFLELLLSSVQISSAKDTLPTDRGVISFKDSLATYSFSTKNGALTKIGSIQTDHNFIKPNHPSPLFLLELKPPGVQPLDKLFTLSSFDAECVKCGVEEVAPKGFYKKLLFSYLYTTAEGSLTVTIQIKFKNPGESYWSCSVENNLKGLHISKVTYPVLNGVSAGPTKSETLLIRGSYLVDSPSQKGHFRYWWPGVLYPMLDISTSLQGISIISHDTTLRTTGVSARGQKDLGTELKLEKIVNIRPGESFNGEPNLIRVHTKDWQTACLLEREWANTAFPAKKSPDWAEELDVFATIGWPVPVWERWGEAAKKIKETINAPLIGMWNYQVPGTFWTVPHPNPIMGDEEDFRAAIHEIHKQGIRYIPYFQSHLVDGELEGTDPEEMVGYLKRKTLWKGYELPGTGFTEQWRLRDITGKPKSYNKHSNDHEVPMTQSSTGFREYKLQWAVDLFGKRFSTDGIYWDSDSKGGPAYQTADLYDNDPGLEGVAQKETQLLISNSFNTFHSNAVFVGEGPPSSVMGTVRDFTLNNVSSLWPGRLLFPKMKVLLGGSNGADPSRQKAFLAGLRFDGIDWEDPLQKAFLWMRQRVKQYLYQALFHNQMGIEVDGKTIETKLFLLEGNQGRGVILNILNKNEKDNAIIKIDKAICGNVQRGWLISSDYKEGPFSNFEDIGDHYKITVPGATASHLLLFSKLNPRLIVSAERNIVAGGKINLKANIDNLDGLNHSGYVTIEPPFQHTSQKTIKFDFSFLGKTQGENQSYTASFSAPLETTPKIYDIPVSIQTEGFSTSTRVISEYIQEPIALDFLWAGPEKLTARIKNKTSEIFSTNVEFTIYQGEVKLTNSEIGKFSYTLQPHSTIDFSFDLSGAATAQNPWKITGEMHYKKNARAVVRVRPHKTFEKTTSFYNKIWPIIANGSLEQYDFRKSAPEKEFYAYSKKENNIESFEKNLPDYWWGMVSDRSPQLTHHKGLSLVVDRNQGRCLRLEPNSRCRTNSVVRLEEGTKYRLRVKIKSSNPTNKDGIILGIYLNPTHFFQTANVSLSTNYRPNTWHELEATFTAKHNASLRLQSGENSVVWFDDFNIVPIQIPDIKE